MKVNIVILIVLVAVTFASARRVVTYAGFDHIIDFETTTMKATAYDIRRFLKPDSTCDLLRQPPLFKSVQLKDWLSEGIVETKEDHFLNFVYMGYESVLIENKLTGAYLVRRCRDFRPQLTELPCESYATGNSDYLKAPNKTVFIGNDRVIILNTITGAFSLHPFDADVHTGGDPFKFASGPLYSGSFPLANLDSASFAYLQLQNNQGDVLLVNIPEQSTIKGFRFDGRAKAEKGIQFLEGIQFNSPRGYSVITMGNNDVFFYNASLSYQRWSFFTDNSGQLTYIQGNYGIASKGEGCLYDNVTACAMAYKCGWCPSTYTCMSFDRVVNNYCDPGCSGNAIVDPNLSNTPIIMPDCFTNPDVNSLHDDIFQSIFDGELALPSDVRLPIQYRKGLGDTSSAEVAPINPLIDNELGENPPNVGKFPNQIVDELNSVALGKVYIPPVESKTVPCMDRDYHATKSLESTSIEDWKMNNPTLQTNLLPNISKISPEGEANTASESKDCARQLNSNVNITGSINITRGFNSSLGFLNPSPQFSPQQGSLQPEFTNFNAATTSTHFEQDVMNGDKTKFSDLRANTNGPALEIDQTRIQSTNFSLSFLPKEPISQQQTELTVGPTLTSAEIFQAQPSQLMNQGIVTTGLAGADCTDDGGPDGRATRTFTSAMMKSIKKDFPTIEDQLTIPKNELYRPLEPFMGSTEGQQ